jgi:formylglycine-generating enzyme required for sulfatase activity
MVVVPAGSFRMGDLSGGEKDEKPVHGVTIARPFAVGKYEVTFDDWDACVAGGGCNGYRPQDKGWGRGRHPVIYVSWDDAKAYVAWLSRKTGKQYRLLTEAEWEYAARAGTVAKYWWGGGAPVCRKGARRGAKFDDDAGCNDTGTELVGSYAANPFGLYDMHGNVWEWVEDCWHGSYRGASGDGGAWTSGGNCKRRVLRGGSWSSTPWLLRSAIRIRNSAGNRGGSDGFRVARTL